MLATRIVESAFVSKAVAAAMAIIAGFGGPGVVGPFGDRTATREELVVLFTEAEAVAPRASEWCGWQIPPEVVFAIGTKESCWRNLCRHCRGGGPDNERSAGYFALTHRCVIDGARSIGLWCPTESEETCDWTVANPRSQVRIVLQRIAKNVRRNSGDLWLALAHYGPEDADRDYPAEIRQVWRRSMGGWPANGRLQRR